MKATLLMSLAADDAVGQVIGAGVKEAEGARFVGEVPRKAELGS